MFWCFGQSAETFKFSFPSVTGRNSTVYSLTTSILAMLSILIGFAPDYHSWQSLSRNTSILAYSQDLSEVQINKYAKAILNIESERKQAYTNIQSILGKEPPEIICNQSDTMRNLVPDAQKIAVNYCLKSKQYVESSGLTVTEFNTITKKVRESQSLEKLIGQRMLKLKSAHP